MRIDLRLISAYLMATLFAGNLMAAPAAGEPSDLFEETESTQVIRRPDGLGYYYDKTKTRAAPSKPRAIMPEKKIRMWGAYVGLKGGFNFVNHGYYFDGDRLSDGSVEMAMSYAAELNVGKYLADEWRVQVDLGILGKAEDKKTWDTVDSPGLKFSESGYYAAANLIYGAKSGPYVGLGLGGALAKTEFNSGSDDKSELYPMGQVLIGYEIGIDDRLSIDLGAKLSGWMGKELNYTLIGEDDADIFFDKLDTGFVWNVGIMAGLRYNF